MLEVLVDNEVEAEVELVETEVDWEVLLVERDVLVD